MHWNPYVVMRHYCKDSILMLEAGIRGTDINTTRSLSQMAHPQAQGKIHFDRDLK